MISLNKANTKGHFKIIEMLADSIWKTHYPGIISVAQIDYMLAKFNSVDAIISQIAEGVDFYIMTFESVPVGYMAIKMESDYLFLSKLYVLKDYRGKGIGKLAIQFIINEATTSQLNSIQLKVNKYNTNSILAYEKLGFKKGNPIITEIGQGFIMDDYEMIKLIKSEK